ELQQRLGRAMVAPRRVRPRRHHDPGVPLLHPRGHRPVIRSLIGLHGTMPLAAWAYWQQTLVKVIAVMVIVPTATALIVQTFLFKVMAHMQSRLGPMEARPHGSLHLMADGSKF